MDFATILGENYKEDMTNDELVAALKDAELDDGSTEIERLKRALSKSNSEASDYKKQLRSKMTQEEIDKAEALRKEEELKAKYDALLKETTSAKHKAKLMALGYDEALAEATAAAICDGDFETVFMNSKKNIDNTKRQLKAELLKTTPAPDGKGGSEKTITPEQFYSMGYKERVELSRDNPELYNKLDGGN